MRAHPWQRLLVLAGLGVCWMAAPAPAQEALRQELATVAQSVKKVVDEEKQDAVAVGEFTGPAQLDSNFGPGIQKMLSEELVKLKVTVKKDANLSVKGKYANVQDPVDKAQAAIKLTVEVLDRNDNRKAEFTAQIRDNTTIAKIPGATTSLPPNGDKETRNKAIQNAIQNPDVHLEGPRVSAKKGSPYAVEVLVRAKGQGEAVPLAVAKKDGQAFVDVARGDTYEVRVSNSSEFEAAVTLTIDGLNVFTFSEVRDKPDGPPRYNHFIVPPKAAFTIVGWHKTNTESLAFLVTEHGKGAVSQAAVKATGTVGVLTVTFAVASNLPGDLPSDDGARNAGQNETGFGPPRKGNLKEVERTIGVVRDIVSIRYTK